ncbi:MAG: DUF1772 domain-containing protein [Ramlibacter sp.]|nr:DUF1772 domain-containing protein [Ramlibacter sp.]
MRRYAQTLALPLHTLAILWLGLMAGFFATYSANVNLAMLQMDGPTYAVVQSAFNRNVRHMLFFSFFFGPPVWCGLALLAASPERRQAWWGLLAAAAAIYLLGIIVFTHQVNLPLNAQTEAWSPQALPPDWATVRDQWNVANLMRTLVSFGAFALALVALALRAGRPQR